MRILSKLNHKLNWSLRIMCDGCGSLLEVEKEDIYRTKCYYYNGETSDCYTTVCPNCGREKDISSSLLPSDIIYECQYIGCNNREKVLNRYRSQNQKRRWF